MVHPALLHSSLDNIGYKTKRLAVIDVFRLILGVGHREHKYCVSVFITLNEGLPFTHCWDITLSAFSLPVADRWPLPSMQASHTHGISTCPQDVGVVAKPHEQHDDFCEQHEPDDKL